MRVEDMIMVSIDDHVVEPRDMFEKHVPAAWADKAPKIVRDADGIEKWEWQGNVAGSMGLNAVVSWPKEEWGFDPVGFAEMRPGAYDVHERVRDMNRNGILGSMCFPTFAGFSATQFHSAPDKECSLVMLRAYNDWHIDEWCGAYPGRFIPLALVPTWDADLMVEEIHRVAKKGAKGVSMPELPHIQGGIPPYHDLDFWGPVFKAFSDTGLVMCLHIGQGLGAINPSPGGSLDNLIIIATQVSALAAQDLLWGGAFMQYPDLKVAWSEAGIGWIPFYLDRCDRHFTNQTWLGNDFGGKLPSEVFKEHSLACYVTDPSALKIRHDIGIETIAWECDYPHSDSIWPDAPEFVFAEMANAGVPDEEMDMITWENACRFFDWDPFTAISKEQANVGGLRALSPDVDTTIRSRSEWRELYESSGAR